MFHPFNHRLGVLLPQIGCFYTEKKLDFCSKICQNSKECVSEYKNMKNLLQPKRNVKQKFFPLPNAIFRIGLTSGEILVYTYLMYCEDRKTYQCHPSYSTIGEAIGMSKNTVKKHVDGLRKKGLITTKYTTVTTKDGRIHNGSLLYTLLPIEAVEETYFQKMLQLQRARISIQKGLEKDQEKKEKIMRKGGKNEAVHL